MYTYSIVIPTLNEESIIKELILTLQKQSYVANEIIIADKSTDKTPNIAKEVGAIVVEGANDYFVGRARNNGAKVATGDLIFYFDADNLIQDKEYIKNFIIEFEKQNLDAAHSTLVPNNQTIVNKILFGIYNFFRKLGPKIGTIFSDVGSGIVVKRSVFEKVGGFKNDIRNSEDIVFLTKVMKEGYKYRVLNFPLETSDRRISGKHPLLLLLLFVFLPIDTFLKKRGANSEHWLVKKIEKLYHAKW